MLLGEVLEIRNSRPFTLKLENRPYSHTRTGRLNDWDNCSTLNREIKFGLAARVHLLIRKGWLALQNFLLHRILPIQRQVLLDDGVV